MQNIMLCPLIHIHYFSHIQSLYRNLCQCLLNVVVCGRIGDEPIQGLRVVNVVEEAKLGTEHLLGEELAKDMCGCSSDVSYGEVIAQQKIEVQRQKGTGTFCPCP